MDLMNEYRSKLCTAEEAVRLVKSGDWVDYGSNNGYPPTLDAALAASGDTRLGACVKYAQLLCLCRLAAHQQGLAP